MPDTAATATARALIPAPRAAPHDTAPARFPLARHLQAVVALGLHPATGAQVHPDPAVTCADCVHAIGRRVADGTVRSRCELSPSRRHGPDLVPNLPGCVRHRPAETPS